MRFRILYKKLKTFLLLTVVLFTFFSINAQANELVDSQIKSPDYSSEFNGKDSCEKFNRTMFKFNRKLNKYVVRPINVVWASIFPKYVMKRLDSAFHNIGYPTRLLSSLFQKDFKSSGIETARFVTNSTLGLVGLYDPAEKWFKLKPREEDMGQALANMGVKKGPYLYLPFVGSTNLRDAAGSLLAAPLKPSFYLGGPTIAIANGTNAMNKTSQAQDFIKIAEKAFIDPYELSKQFYGFNRYRKIENLDHQEIFLEKIAENTEEITGTAKDLNTLSSKLHADIKLPNFQAQSSTIDSFRSMLFDKTWEDDSAWLELSVWNRDFNKKIKTASVKLKSGVPKYEYKYLINKKKNSPLAIIYPTIGADINAKKSVALTKILNKAGYSVLIVGSNFHWEFIKNMPKGYRPGYLPQDAYYLRHVTSRILKDLQKRTHKNFNKKLVVGTSWGAINTLFVASQEKKDNLLGISQYISINPPVDLIYAVKQVDSFIVDWKRNDKDIKLASTLTFGKIGQMSQQTYKNINKDVSLPLNESEAKLLVGTTMKQKLSDLILALEEKSKTPKCEIYKKIISMDFYDYMSEYIVKDSQESFEKFRYNSSLYSLADFLKESKNVIVYHSLDDYFVSDGQLEWLKEQMGERAVLFSNGSHLGYLYRKEFTKQFKKEINIENTTL